MCFSAMTCGVALMCGGAGAGMGGTAIEAVETRAYDQLIAGEVWEGSLALVDLLRTVPGDDPALADSMTGPAQLLGFAVTFLMNWDQRRALQNEYLKPDEYVTDRLLIAGVKVAADLGRAKYLESYVTLREIATGDHEAARVAALCFLADPYYFQDLPSVKRHTAELYLRYGDRAIARNLLRQTLCKTVKAQVAQPPAKKSVFAGILYSGGRPGPIRAVDPAIARVTDVLPGYRIGTDREQAVREWADLAKSEADEEVRYLSLRLLAAADGAPEGAVHAREAAREAAARAEDTRDAALARGMALEYARKALDFDEMGQWAHRLLQQGLLPGEPERCLYEWEVRAAQHAAETYARYGYHQEAQNIYRGLARKYPRSELAERCTRLAHDIAENPVGVSMALLRREARHRFGREGHRESADFYRTAAALTPHASLAAACTSEADTFEERAAGPAE